MSWWALLQSCPVLTLVLQWQLINYRCLEVSDDAESLCIDILLSVQAPVTFLSLYQQPPAGRDLLSYSTLCIEIPKIVVIDIFAFSQCGIERFSLFILSLICCSIYLYYIQVNVARQWILQQGSGLLAIKFMYCSNSLLTITDTLIPVHWVSDRFTFCHFLTHSASCFQQTNVPLANSEIIPYFYSRRPIFMV